MPWHEIPLCNPQTHTIHLPKIGACNHQGTLPGPNHIAIFIQPRFDAQMSVAHRLVLNIFQSMCQGCLALTLRLWQLHDGLVVLQLGMGMGFRMGMGIGWGMSMVMSIGMSMNIDKYKYKHEHKHKYIFKYEYEYGYGYSHAYGCRYIRMGVGMGVDVGMGMGMWQAWAPKCW